MLQIGNHTIVLDLTTLHLIRVCAIPASSEKWRRAGGDGWAAHGLGRGQLNPSTPAAGARAIHTDRQGQGVGARASDRGRGLSAPPFLPTLSCVRQLRDGDDGMARREPCFAAAEQGRGGVERGDEEDAHQHRAFIGTHQSSSALPSRSYFPSLRSSCTICLCPFCLASWISAPSWTCRRSRRPTGGPRRRSFSLIL